MEQDNDKGREEQRKLTGFPKKGSTYGMRTPEGYFDNLADRALARTESSESNSAPKRIPLRTWLQAAAAVGLLVVVAYVALTPSGSEDQSVALDAISADDAYTYVYEYANEYVAEDIYTVYADNNNLELLDLDLEQTNYAIDGLLEEIDPEILEQLF